MGEEIEKRCETPREDWGETVPAVFRWLAFSLFSLIYKGREPGTG